MIIVEKSRLGMELYIEKLVAKNLTDHESKRYVEVINKNNYEDRGATFVYLDDEYELHNGYVDLLGESARQEVVPLHGKIVKVKVSKKVEDLLTPNCRFGMFRNEKVLNYLNGKNFIAIEVVTTTEIILFCMVVINNPTSQIKVLVNPVKFQRLVGSELWSYNSFRYDIEQLTTKENKDFNRYHFYLATEHGLTQFSFVVSDFTARSEFLWKTKYNEYLFERTEKYITED